MLNQQGFGAPQGGVNPLSPIASFVDSKLEKAKGRREDANAQVVHHALASIRQDRAHANASELQTQRINATAAEGEANRAFKERMQKSQQRHEMRGLKATQGHEIATRTMDQAHAVNLETTKSQNRRAEQREVFRGIARLGKSGRVGEFKMGDIHTKYNPYTSPAPTSQSPAPAAPEQPQAVSTPAPVQTAKPSLMWNNPTTGRIEKRPEGAPAPVAKKAAAKKATPRPRKK